MENGKHSSDRLLAQFLGVSVVTLKKAYQLRDYYKQHQIKKRSGGVRIIHEPPPLLKKVQRKILTKFFYPLIKKDCVERRLFGFIPQRSIANNAYEHTKQPWNFLYKMDLKDAFPSVKSIHLSVALRDFILSKTEEDVLLFRKKKSSYEEDKEIHHRRKKRRKSQAYFLYGFSFHCLYATQNNTLWFRKLLLGSEEDYATAQLLLIKCIDSVVDLCTLPSGELPQGASTSGFATNIVLSNVDLIGVLRGACFVKGWQNSVSVYADDIAISTMKRLSKEDISYLVKKVEEIGIWKIHPDKHHSYTRKCGGPIVCGVRIGRFSVSTEDQAYKLYTHSETTYSHLYERLKSGNTWTIDFITIPKRLKKKIRALRYKLKQNPQDAKLRSIVEGYRGYQIDVQRKSQLPFKVFASR